MKKFIAVLMALLMVCSLAACGGGENTTTDAPATQEAVTDVATTEAVSDVLVLAGGESGDGEAKLDAGLFTMTVPEGLKYEVYTYYMDASNNLATIEVNFGKSSATEGRVTVTTQRMVKSLDDSEAESIRMYSSFDGMESESLGEVTIGGMTFKKLHITTQYQDKTILVSYYNNPAADMYADTFIEITTDTNRIDLADSAVTALIESIVLK